MTQTKHESYISNGLMRRIEMVGTCEPYGYGSIAEQMIDVYDDWIVEPFLSGQRVIIHYCPETSRLSFFEGSGYACSDWGKNEPNIRWVSEENKTFSKLEVVLDSIKTGDTYYVFDCLFYAVWLLNNSLVFRKKICKEIIQGANDNRFVFVKPISGKPPKKGVIYKRKNSKYIAGFSYDWVALPHG